ncbi:MULTISPECIES: protease HtpX [Acinetobacter]|uniref:protease HtpX n=1 Tax=Acinetobacter TaxID=469 RepID=UPI0018A27AC2|nr:MULTISPECIES: protease HtpX [Acinetobacter]MBF7691093.1 protease HtpX [Acinetobacter pollinis]MBF7693619.1 protease HtpX [Acinetobacter pollinis]MBF7698732.1 protease HtpX [Acinetobacter pollinis]MBF7701458.1 protease HtpX [Acinetobacter pollinis]WEV48067.1 protease HtpX [Acinetobacter sp. ESL0695]
MMRIGLFLLTNLAVLVVAGLILSVLGVGSYHGAGGLKLGNLLVMCFVFGMVGSLISLFMSKWMAKMSTGTELINPNAPRNQAEVWLLQTVAELSQRAGIKMPEVGIFPSYQSNAFATGWNKNDALVAVSSGILENMSQDELRAVIGHEIGHVANGDMVTLSLVQGVVNTFVMFFARVVGDFIDRNLLGREDGDPPGIAYFVITMVLDIVFGVLASAVVMWFSRYREYRADEAGAQLAGKQAMINALLRLKAESGMPDQMPKEMKALAITEGKSEGFSLAALFQTHPSIDERVEALQRYNCP